LASGSRICASKPADITIRSGRKSRSRGRMDCSNAVRNSLPPSPARKGALTIVLLLAALAHRSGARIERHFVGRAIHHARIGPEDLLRAVAVMHVEVDDRDPLQAVPLLRVARRDRRIVENRQKPIGRVVSAWCPGGRTATNALGARLPITSSTASVAPPAPRSAASKLRATWWCRHRAAPIPAAARRPRSR